MRRREKLFWLAIGAVFLIGFIFLIPTYGQICEINTETKHEDCARYHSALIALRHLSKFFDDHNGALTALFTIILSVSTIGLWRATNKLYDAGERQLKLIESNAGEQSKDTRILQRAYLAVEGDGISPVVINPQTSVAHIKVKNVGHLPARDVRWFIDTAASDNGRLDHFPIDESVIYGRNTVPPGTEMRRSQNFSLSKTDFDLITQGGGVFYVWGEIKYLDGFGETRRTSFCHRYGHRGFKRTGEISGEFTAESMRYHQFGNDAD